MSKKEKTSNCWHRMNLHVTKQERFEFNEFLGNLTTKVIDLVDEVRQHTFNDESIPAKKLNHYALSLKEAITGIPFLEE